jgi:hypothetical protein
MHLNKKSRRGEESGVIELCRCENFAIVVRSRIRLCLKKFLDYLGDEAV